MDKVTPERRSENMRRIKSKGMKPELLVRSLAHKMGYRFRLHRRDLPGKPDLVFGPRRKAIFIHGCFWHQHPGCREGRLPTSNQGYWRPKLARNVTRDAAAITELHARGWKTLVIWECETEEHNYLKRTIRTFLGKPKMAVSPTGPNGITL
jgi:DNA mismatch endonuclease, patch repair protein